MKIEDPRRRKEQNKHDHRHDITDHDGVQCFETEAMAAILDLFGDPVRADDPSDEDRGEHGDERHHETVADVVHHVEELADASARKGHFDVKNAVPQRDHDGNCRVEDR